MSSFKNWKRPVAGRLTDPISSSRRGSSLSRLLTKPQPRHDARTILEWADFAARCATDTHHNHFHSRHGVWYFEGCDALVVYNNPYANDTRRTAEILQFCERLAEQGIAILSSAYSPDRYTYALVIDA